MGPPRPRKGHVCLSVRRWFVQTTTMVVAREGKGGWVIGTIGYAHDLRGLVGLSGWMAPLLLQSHRQPESHMAFCPGLLKISRMLCSPRD